jgi:hypothetical protein
VTTGCCNLEWLGLFALLVNVNHLTRLHAERWAINSLAINQDVAVNYHLSCLRHGASKSRTKYQGV